MSRSRQPAAVFGACLAVATLVLSPVLGDFTGDGTFYGNNGWAGACAGLVPLTGQPWPPPGGTYQNSMSPGSSTPFNVAINSAQWSVPMCGKLLMVRGTTTGCTTCGETPIPNQYMLARVTNECPECQFGSLDFGMAGDGRWLISWYFVDSPPSSVATQNTGAVARAPVPKPKPKPVPVVHHHTPTYYARLKAMAAKKPHHHTPTYYARLRAAQLRSAAKKKGRKLLMLGDALTFSTEQQLQLPSADAVASQQ